MDEANSSLANIAPIGRGEMGQGKMVAVGEGVRKPGRKLCTCLNTGQCHELRIKSHDRPCKSNNAFGLEAHLTAYSGRNNV